jgi:photosystem II stability/assembly factor-like uncharacterized protein
VYVAGTTSSTDFPVTPDAYQREPQATPLNTSHDGFLAVLNAAGSDVVYSTYIGTPAGSTDVQAVAVSPAGDVWVLARAPTQFPATHDVSSGGAVFLGHLLPNRSLATWTRLAGTQAAGLALDRLSRPHALTQFGTGGSLVLTQLDATGTRANFARPIPATNAASAVPISADLAVGPDGTILVTGLRGEDAFIEALNPQGIPEVVSALGGIGVERHQPQVAVDADRQVHVAFETLSFDLPTERAVLAEHPDAPIYVSETHGSSWRRTGTSSLATGPSAPLSAFAFDAGRDNVYAMVAGALFASGNNGATWRRIRGIESFGYRTKVAADPRDSTTLYIGESNLYRFDLAAGTLTELRRATAGVGGFRVDSVAVSPHDGSVWVGTGSGAEVSVDRGRTWTRRDNGLTTAGSGRTFSPRAWAIDVRQPGRMIVATEAGVFGTEDAGHSWQELTRTLTSLPGSPERPLTEAVVLDAADPRRIYAGTFNRGILVSDDRGATWRYTTPPMSLTAIAASSQPPYEVYAAVTASPPARFGVIVSYDGGRTWSWSLETRSRLSALASNGPRAFASAMADVAPYVTRVLPRNRELARSFASYLLESGLRDVATTPLGETVLVFNTTAADVAVVRLGR